MTSAGIFDADGRLLRTLWSGRALSRGAVAVDWDGRDEGGAPVPEHGHYMARVLSHNVRYVWEGVIGNTSSASIPLALDEAYRQGRIARGDLVLFSGFGAGLTWGTMLLRW